MATKRTRSDLAAMLHPILRELLAMETPIFAVHGVSMWGYVVLNALDKSAVRTQTALAEAINADKSRIIPTLDELQQRGYIQRRRDPADRRVQLLEITAAGRHMKNAVQSDIQRGERRWLDQLTGEQRKVFLGALERLRSVSAPSGEDDVE